MRFDALAILRHKRRITLQTVVVMFAVTGLVVTSEGSTRFQMLPALPSHPTASFLTQLPMASEL
jgi:hypothetical protein